MYIPYEKLKHNDIKLQCLVSRVTSFENKFDVNKWSKGVVKIAELD